MVCFMLMLPTTRVAVVIVVDPVIAHYRVQNFQGRRR